MNQRFKQSERVICINNEGYPKTLEVGREYRAIMNSQWPDRVIIEAGGRVAGFEVNRFKRKENKCQ